MKKLEDELIFHLGETTVHEKAKMMFPMWAPRDGSCPSTSSHSPRPARTPTTKAAPAGGLCRNDVAHPEEISLLERDHPKRSRQVVGGPSGEVKVALPAVA